MYYISKYENNYKTKNLNIYLEKTEFFCIKYLILELL
jgi:hypothetical protein